MTLTVAALTLLELVCNCYKNQMTRETPVKCNIISQMQSPRATMGNCARQTFVVFIILLFVPGFLSLSGADRASGDADQHSTLQDDPRGSFTIMGLAIALNRTSTWIVYEHVLALHSSWKQMVQDAGILCCLGTPNFENSLSDMLLVICSLNMTE